jgi:DNA-binding MarR family transcriptional regulator
MNAPQPARDGRQSILALTRLITETRGFFHDLENISAKILAPEGLTPQERRLMMSLRKHRQCTVPRLARINEVSRQYVQTVMNALSKGGWVVFRDNPDHKRSRLLVLSPDAEERIQGIMAQEGEMLQKVAAGLSPDGGKQAVAVLRQAREMLKGEAG